MTGLPPREDEDHRATTRHVPASTPPPDGPQEPHGAFAPGPFQIALRLRIEEDRRRLPRPLRVSLWGAVGLVGLALLLAIFLAVVDPTQLAAVGLMLGATFVVGREAALLLAYGQAPATGPGWMASAGVLDDLIVLGFALSLIWLGFERLRGAPFIGGVLLSLEKAAVEQRGVLRKWGLYGLVALVWLPGVGTGVVLAATIGILSKIPLRRLVVALAFAAISVNVFWAVALYHTSALIPPGGLWSYIPLFCVAGFAILLFVVWVRRRRKRHLFPLVKVQMLEEQHIARLYEVGITDGIDLLYVNREVLAEKLGMDPTSLGRLRSVAELAMLRTVTPRQAELLTEVGITTIRELAVAPPELVAAALHELQMQRSIHTLPEEAEVLGSTCEGWTEDARVFFAESES